VELPVAGTVGPTGAAVQKWPAVAEIAELYSNVRLGWGTLFE
jgi:hypothetical protein